jgi:hypothetical protein
MCLGLALDATRQVGSTPLEDLERGVQNDEIVVLELESVSEN